MPLLACHGHVQCRGMSPPSNHWHGANISRGHASAAHMSGFIVPLPDPRRLISRCSDVKFYSPPPRPTVHSVPPPSRLCSHCTHTMASHPLCTISLMFSVEIKACKRHVCRDKFDLLLLIHE